MKSSSREYFMINTNIQAWRPRSPEFTQEKDLHCTNETLHFSPLPSDISQLWPPCRFFNVSNEGSTQLSSNVFVHFCNYFLSTLISNIQSLVFRVKEEGTFEEVRREGGSSQVTTYYELHGHVTRDTTRHPWVFHLLVVTTLE